jgi:hypothetical protein
VHSKGNYREYGVAHWCSREESVVLYCKAGEFMGRGRGQEGNECPVRETLGRMVIPTGVAGTRV